MASLLLKNIKKSYLNNPILHGINLHIENGEFIVFVGPSGCGKSTLLRSIAGLEEINEGELFIGDKMMNQVSPSERGIAMVFQNYALYPHMSVYDNMAFGLKLSGMPADEISAVVNSTAKTLKIENLLTRKPKALSGGQRQRVAIGRAIVRKPDVFLFDEPLSNLDASLRVQMRIELANLHRLLRTTMIYVTHDQTEAMTLADRIVVLNAGNIEQVGSPLELYNHPINTFVAGFIGSPNMNFIECTENNSSAGMLNFTLLSGEHCSIGSAIEISAGARFTIGIRPENIIINATQGISVRVQAIEKLGDMSYLYLQMNEQSESIIARVATEANWEIDQQLFLDLTGTRLHLFDHLGVCLSN